MHRPSTALWAALVLLATRAAFADTVASSRYELTEETHAISVVVDRGYATLVVRRTVLNTGPKSDQAIFWIEVPETAVATRLRSAGTDSSGKAVWFEGDLMDAEEAAAKYKELTGLGGFYPKDPALLSWRSQGTLALQVFPVPPMAPKTVEYTLEMPMRYEEGTYRMELPALGTHDRPAVVRLAAAHGSDRLRVNGVATAKATVEATQNIAIDLQPAADHHLSGGLAEVPLGPGRVFFHGHVEAPAHLGEVPPRAAVAVVLDTSKSMAGALAPAMAAARAYLRNFGADAEVTLVTFDRRVETPLGSARPVLETLARMQAFAPTARNGSRLDEAVARADAALAASKAGARRMLVLTDLLTRRALTPQYLTALTLTSGCTVHVATVEPSVASALTRDDDDAWSSFPRKTGGVLWRAEAPDGDRADPHIFDEWARPKRIDHVKVVGFPGDFSPPDTLDEGFVLEHLGFADTRRERISIEGELWSRPTKFEATPSAAEERRWSALVFGSPLLGQLTEPEQRLLAMKGRAVSPMTSYLAIEPGVRPSIDGLEEEAGRGDGIGVGDLGGSGYGTGGGESVAPRPDPQAFLDRELGQAWSRCGGSGTAAVDLESTRAEVVEVGHVTLSQPSAAVAACVREAVWSLDLPVSFDGAHADWSVHLGG